MNTTHRVEQLILLLDVTHPDDLPLAEAAQQELLDLRRRCRCQPVAELLAAALTDRRYPRRSRRTIHDVLAQMGPTSSLAPTQRRSLLACALDRLRDHHTLAHLVEECLAEAVLDLDREDHVALVADLTDVLRAHLPHAADLPAAADTMPGRPLRYEVALLLHSYRQSPDDPTRWPEDPTSPLRLMLEETDNLERATAIVQALKTFYEQSGL